MNHLEALVRVMYNIYLVLNKEQLTFTFIDLFGDPDAQLTRQQVKDYLNISESTYKRKVKDGTLKPVKLPAGCLPGKPAKRPNLITLSLPFVYPFFVPG